MFIINVSNPITLLLILAITVLLIILGKEIKKSFVTAIPLGAFLVLLVMHVIQFMSLTSAEIGTYLPILTKCLAIDFIFILMTFVAYLWVDDIEAKVTKKKSIDNSLSWFWNKI